MDGKRFDDISRLLGARTGRRAAIGGLVAALLGSATRSGADAALPQRATCRPLTASCLRNAQCCSGACDTRRTAPRKQRNRCICPGGQTNCGGSCVDTTSSMTRCGACDTACDTERADACVSGVCTCGGDPACTGTDLCVDGICETPPEPECSAGNWIGEPCTYATDCCSLTCTDGFCAQPTTDCAGFTGSAFDPSASFCVHQVGRTGGAAFSQNMVRCGFERTNPGPTACTSTSECQAVADQFSFVIGVCAATSRLCSGGGSCRAHKPDNSCYFFYSRDTPSCS